MAIRVRKFNRGHVIGHGNGKYPWADWADGSIWQIEQGKDFTCTIPSMRQYLYRVARHRGQRIVVHVDGDVIQFQFRQDDKLKLAA